MAEYETYFSIHSADYNVKYLSFNVSLATQDGYTKMVTMSIIKQMSWLNDLQEHIIMKFISFVIASHNAIHSAATTAVFGTWHN